MKRNNHSFNIPVFRYIGIPMLLSAAMCIHAQSDSALNRSVTVERDFQPVIQDAGKVATKPAVVTTTFEPASVEYSGYMAEVETPASVNPMLSQPTRFDAGKKFNGYVRGGLGHTNTLFDFGYHLDDGKKSILDVYAHHRAVWGTPALSRTKIGLNFTHPFATCDLYFGVNGGNIYYHKYGDLYNRSLPRNNTQLWTAEAYLGVKANAKQDFQYLVQTGYALFAKPGAVSEHQIRTKASFDWHSEAHHIGMKFYMQNNFMALNSLAAVIPDSLYNSRHNLRIEPYYAYNGRRVQLHIGVNLDVNIGRGKNALSGTKNISFAPSPHVHLEAQIAKQWLTLYADATGSHGLGSLQSYMESNRYRIIHAGIASHHVTSYTPVDAEAGFHIRPHRDLLIEIHGGYALLLNQMTLIANPFATTKHHASGIQLMPGEFAYTYSDYGRGKIGAQFNYHYRDYVRVNLSGDYFIWSAYGHEKVRYDFATEGAALKAITEGSNKTVYDRPSWQLALRVDGRIDRHWSLYSDNRFEGSRLALVADGTEYRLKPRIDMNLGVQYEMWLDKKGKITNPNAQSKAGILRPEPKPNLVLFAQLNDFIHHRNEIYYGYHTIGINFLIGATFRF